MTRDDASAFVDAIREAVPTRGRTPKTATVQAVTGALCTLLFDGETVVGAKPYPCLKSYVPAVGDRVVVMPVGSATSWLILGAIDPGGTAPTLTLTNTTAVGTQSVVKRSGLVAVNFRLTTTATIAQYGALATLPTGYRPDPTGIDLFFSGAVQGGGTWVQLGLFVDATTGIIKPLTTGIASGLIVSGTVTFPAGA